MKTVLKKGFLKVLSLITLLISVAQIAYGGSLHLEWNGNSESDLAGYNVYYGTSPGSYGSPLDVGDVTEYELTGLDEGIRYYVAITAYDTSDNESEKSDEESGLVPDTQNPTITITSPTSSSSYGMSSSSITLGGSASDNVGVTQVSWVNSSGGSGTASGTSSWSASGIALQEGTNVITVTARDGAGHTGSDSITVTYTPPDTQNPTVTITVPTPSPVYSTTDGTVTLGGSSTDNVGVTEVRWINNQGGSGTASGTIMWSADVFLSCGENNIITLTAEDEAGNTGTDTLTVNVGPCKPGGLVVR